MVSIILPVYNCIPQFRNGIPQLQEILVSSGVSFEILVVDDASADVDELAVITNEYGCVLIKNKNNLGKGASIKRGVFAASGELLIFMDGDFPFKLSIISEMLAEFNNTSADIVIGDRSLPASKYPKLSFTRIAGSKILSGILNSFVLRDFPDSQCGIKGFRRNVARSIFDKVSLKGFSFDVELLFIARLRKYKIHRLPVHVLEQEQSSVRIMRDGALMAVGLTRLMVRYLSGKYNTK